MTPGDRRDEGAPRRAGAPLPDPPAWAQLCDVLVVLLVTLGAAVAITGGIRERIAGGPMVSFRSPWRPVLVALLVALLRHAVTRRPALHERVADGFRQLWASVAHVAWPLLYAAAVALFLTSVLADRRPDTGLTAFIQFGDKFDAQALPAVREVPHYVHQDSWGYDGQFYVQLAVDPWLRDPDLRQALDAPSYRARRILFSWTAYTLGLGRPSWVLQIYAWQNIVAWLLLAVVLLRWCPPGNARHFAVWVSCLFSTGMLASVRLALTDGPSMLLIACAVAAVERGRTGLATCVVALAGLGRETNLLAAVALPPPRDAQVGTQRRCVVTGLLMVLPLAAWMAYVRLTLGAADAGIETLAMPLRGYLQKWSVTVAELGRAGWWSDARFSVYALVGFTVQAGFLLVRWRLWPTSPWWRVGLAYAALMAVAGASVWDGHPGAITRVVVPLMVAFNVVILRERRFWPLLLLGNLGCVEEVWFL